MYVRVLYIPLLFTATSGSYSVSLFWSMMIGVHLIGLFQPLPEESERACPLPTFSSADLGCVQLGSLLPLPEEAACACPSCNFYSSVAIVERANSTDSAACWKNLPLFQPLPAPALVEVGRRVCLPVSSGRG